METKKQKFVKILKRIGIALSVGFNVIFLIAIIIGSSGIKNKGNNLQVACAESEVINVDNQVNKKNVVFHDADFEITFSLQELNNYSFPHFCDYLNNNADYNNLSQTDITYGEVVYSLDEWLVNDSISYLDGNHNMITLDCSHDFNFIYNAQPSVFEGDLIWLINEDLYIGAKNAIELDIQANESNINDGIFETLTSGVVAFIGSISSGITSMTSVFYDSANSQLTTIGLLSVIVVAISLAYFLFRLIIGLIRMRG